MKLSPQEIAERFSSVTPTEELAGRLQELRENFIVFAETLNNELPECRAKSLALTHLEDTAMWAIKALCREPIGHEYLEKTERTELVPGADENDRWKELKRIPEPGTN